MGKRLRGWGWRVTVGVIVAVIAVAGAWPLLADGQPWGLAVAGVAALLAVELGPMLVERLTGRREGRQAWRRQLASVRVADPESSVARLLHPAGAVVPFAGRDEQQRLLRAWCEQDGAVAVRLVAAPGGFGKTRLAAQFAATMSRSRWQVLMVAPGDDAIARSAAVVADEHAARRLLVVVDYAEARNLKLLAGLVAAVIRRDRHGVGRVRLLLLARTAGLWWDRLSAYSDQDSAVIDSVTRAPANVITLPAHVDDRTPRKIIEDAAEAFALRLGRPVPAGLPAGDRVPDAPLLRLHAHALVAVLGSPGDGGHDVLDEVLRHESEYWLHRARRTHPPLIASDVDPELLEHNVAPLRQLAGIAALLGVHDSHDMTGLVHRTPALAGVDTPTAARWAAWLADLYPAGPDNAVGALQPDLLAEHLSAELLTGCDAGQLARMFAGVREAQAVQALTVIGRAVPQHPALAALIGPVLAADVTVMTGAVIAVAVQFPGLYTGVLFPLLPGDLELSRLRELARRIGHPSMELAQIAVALTKAVIDGTPPGDSPDDRAAWLAMHAVWLAEAGRRAEALAHSEQAVALLRVLADGNRHAHLPNLAMSVNNHAARLAEAGRRAEALAHSEQAVALLRELADGNRHAYLPNLASAVGNHALQLAEAGRRPEALAFSEESVTLLRLLADGNRDAYLPNLASAVGNHALRLAEAGRRAEALTHSEMALALRRVLAERNRDVHLPDLASAVGNHALQLAEAGRRAEALTHSEQALGLYRELAEGNRDAHLPNLAMSMGVHALRLAEAGRRPEALALSEEVITLLRELVEGNRDAYLPGLALGLWRAALVRHVLGAELDRAVSLCEEAVGIYTSLMAHEPEAFAHHLDSARNTLADILYRPNRTAQNR